MIRLQHCFWGCHCCKRNDPKQQNIALCRRCIRLRFGLRGAADRICIQAGGSAGCQLGTVLPPASSNPAKSLCIPRRHCALHIYPDGGVLVVLQCSDPFRCPPELYTASPVWRIDVRHSTVYALRCCIDVGTKAAAAALCRQAGEISRWHGAVLHRRSAVCTAPGIALPWPVLPWFWGASTAVIMNLPGILVHRSSV